jgi:hypothetical protein
MFGRNIPPAMASPTNSYDEISEFAPRCISPTRLGAPAGTKFVHAACGRQHSILVGSNGDMWSAGGNASAQVSGLYLNLEGGKCKLFATPFYTVWSQSVQGSYLFHFDQRPHTRWKEAEGHPSWSGDLLLLVPY